MDEKIAKWIIEYLLRQQSIDEKHIDGIISSLPLSNNDNRLKKTLIFRKIESEISNGTFSEKLLEFFEIIANLDQTEGKPASHLIKEAYCTVAVDCTARFLAENEAENGKYCEAVERVWRNRVCKNEELGSEETSRWWRDIEDAVRDSSVCERILMRNTRNEGLKAVRRYLKEGWESLGPTFLEMLALKVGDDDAEAIRLGGGAVGLDKLCRELVSGAGIQKSQNIIRRKHVAVKAVKPKCTRGAKISDADEIDPDKVQEKVNATCDSHPHPDASQAVHNDNDDNNIGVNNTEEVQEASNINKVEESQTRVQEVLKSSVKELHASVTDPESFVENHAGAETHVAPEVGAVQPETNSGGSTENNPEKVKKGVEAHEPKEQANRKRSLLEPSGTSHTLEGPLSESSPHSSKKAKVNPLQPYVDKKILRKERRKWTPQQEETLRDAVKKFGRRWKFILGCYPDTFADRSDVDLKDKWRNMIK